MVLQMVSHILSPPFISHLSGSKDNYEKAYVCGKHVVISRRNFLGSLTIKTLPKLEDNLQTFYALSSNSLRILYKLYTTSPCTTNISRIQHPPPQPNAPSIGTIFNWTIDNNTGRPSLLCNNRPSKYSHPTKLWSDVYIVTHNELFRQRYFEVFSIHTFSFGADLTPRLFKA